MPTPQALSTLIGPFYSLLSPRTLVSPFCWFCPAWKPSHPGSGFTNLIIAFWSAKTTSLGLLTQPRFSDPLAPPWSSDPLAPPWLVYPLFPLAPLGKSIPWLQSIQLCLGSPVLQLHLGLPFPWLHLGCQSHCLHLSLLSPQLGPPILQLHFGLYSGSSFYNIIARTLIARTITAQPLH